MKRIFFSALVLVQFSIVSAQEEEAARPPLPYLDLTLGGQLGFPLGGFRQEYDKTAYGFGGSLLVQIRPQPVLAGAELGGLWLDRARVEFSAVVDGQERDYRLTSRSHVFQGHAVLRFQPALHPVFWPYLDGLFGFKHFFTRTALVEVEDAFTQTFVEADIDRKDTALSYGLAGGLQIRILSRPSVRADLRCAYLTGPVVTYLVRDPAAQGPFNDPIEAFKEVNSATTILVSQLGVTIDLSSLYFDSPAPEEE